MNIECLVINIKYYIVDSIRKVEYKVKNINGGGQTRKFRGSIACVLVDHWLAVFK